MPVTIHTIPLGFDQCYVVRGDGVIVIDAGQPGKAADFASELEAAGIDSSEVRLIVLTHGHWDHIGSAMEIRALTGAPLAMHRAEAGAVKEAPVPLSPGVTRWGRTLNVLQRPILRFVKVPPVEIDLELDDDDMSLEDYGVAGRIIHTPGHSPGSVSVLLDSGEAFVGDLAMNRLPLRRSPGLPIFAGDRSAVIDSWKHLLALGASTIYPAHGEAFPAVVMEIAVSDATAATGAGH
jgi:glyoxylase-like metal-dependent hydrolase (beta-lactamase superfamily II)